MDATVIDTLRFADRLKEAGFDAPHAEGMARALGDELADRMLTHADLDELNISIGGRFESIDGKFVAINARFEAIDRKFVAMDARFDAMDARFEAMDARFEAIDEKIDNLDSKFEAKLDAMDTKIESVHREGSGKFNVLVGVMAIGFTVLAGLVLHDASPGPSQDVPTISHEASQRHQESPATGG